MLILILVEPDLPPQLEDNHATLAVNPTRTPRPISDSIYANLDVSDTESYKFPGLVKDLTGPLGSKRFKSYIFNYLRTPKDSLMTWMSFTSMERNGSVSVEQIRECFELCDKLQKDSEFNKFLTLISRVEILDMIERRVLEDPKEVWVPKKIPPDLCNQIMSGLQLKTNITLSSWLTISRKFRILRDWLPFIAKPSSIERMPIKDIEQLCKDLNSCNQGLANIGQSFRQFILKQQSYLWESISLENLSTMPDNTLFHTITVRQFVIDEASSQSQSSTGPKVEQYCCDFCRTSSCEYIGRVQALISDRPELQEAAQYQDTQPSWPPPEVSMTSDSLQTNNHFAEVAGAMGSLGLPPAFRDTNFTTG